MKMKTKQANGNSESPIEDTSKQENKSKTSKKVSETPKKAETKSNNVPNYKYTATNVNTRAGGFPYDPQWQALAGDVLGVTIKKEIQK